MAHSKIEWTECTWNPVTGCSKVSPGCAHCYAAHTSASGDGAADYANGFEVIATRAPRLPLT